MATKKRMSGSYGPRYGKTIRKLVQEATDKAHDTYECPTCSKKAVVRVSTSIWECKSCEAKYSGGAYQFTTGASRIIKQALEKPQKSHE